MKVTLECMLCCIVGIAIASCAPKESVPRIHGTQPETKVSLLPESTTNDDVSSVVSAAKAFHQPSSEFWPEPVSISERDMFWWVKFKKKEQVVIRDGKEVVRVELTGGVCIQVEKSDFSCSFVPTP